MSVTITRQTGKISTGSLAIRLNKRYVAEIKNEETLSFDVEAGTILSYNILDIPRIEIEDCQTYLLKRRYLVDILFFSYILVNLLSTYFLSNHMQLHSISQLLSLFIIVLWLFIPKYKFILKEKTDI